MKSTNQKENSQEVKVMDVHYVSVERYFHKTTRSWKVVRVQIQTNYGSIFYKPFKNRKTSREISGRKICLVNKEMIDVKDLNSVILEISDKAINNGICKIKANVRTWKREGRDDYLYFQEEDVNKIEILPLTEKV